MGALGRILGALVPGQKSREPLGLGEWGERHAQEMYRANGYEVVAANVSNPTGKRLGEIDFIARGKGSLVFVEVKTRAAGKSRFGSGLEAVDARKRQRLLKAVHSYLLSHPKDRVLKPQIDVCVLEVGLDRTVKSARILANAVEDWS